MRRALGIALLALGLLAQGPARPGGISPATTTGPCVGACLTTMGSGTTAPAAPSWVSATLAAWMLDDASGGPWVNALGLTTRDFPANGAVLQDQTTKMEGVASISFPGTGAYLTTADGFPTMASPLTVACWARPVTGSTDGSSIFIRFTGAEGIDLRSGVDGTYTFVTFHGGNPVLITTPVVGLNGWTHVVATHTGTTSTLYANGQSAVTNASAPAPTASTQALSMGYNGFKGQLDECFVAGSAWSAAAVCRVCSCGIRGEQCTCNGTAFVSTGRNATNCGSCTLPADCTAPAPPISTTTTSSTTTVAPTTTLPPTTTSTTTTTTTTLIIPTTGAADVNCPNTKPTKIGETTMANTLNASITCATPAATTTVLSISFWAGSGGSTGGHMKCSVYTFPAGYVAGTTAITKVAAGCDTVEWTSPAFPLNAYITLNVTGTCTLAPSTRYQIACNQDLPSFIGYNDTACTVGGVNCWQERSSQTYTGTPLPDPWTANGQGAASFAYYMTVR